MPRQVTFDGTIYTVPDDATDDEIIAFVGGQVAPAEPAAEVNDAGAVSRVPNGGFLDRLSAHYKNNVGEGLSFASEGVDDLTGDDATLMQRGIGAGKTLLGGMQYAGAAPLAAASAVFQDPARLAMHQAGAPQWAVDTAGSIADAAGTVFGGVPAVKAGQVVAREVAPMLNALSKTPSRTSNQILDASKAAYKRAEMTGAVVKPESFREFVDSTEALLRRDGYVPGLHKQVAPVLKELRTAARADTTKNFEDMEKLRRIANQAIMSSSDDANMAMAYKVRNSLDDFTGNVQPHQMQAGNAKEAAAAWKEGRSLYRQYAQMSEIEDIMATVLRQEDPDKYLRQQFTRINKDGDQLKQYTDEQRELIKEIANRGKVESAVSYFSPGSGRNLTQALKSMIGGAAGFAAAGPAGAAAVPLIAATAETVAKARRVGRVNDLTESISRGKTPGYLDRVAANRATIRAMGR